MCPSLSFVLLHPGWALGLGLDLGPWALDPGLGLGLDLGLVSGLDSGLDLGLDTGL